MAVCFFSISKPVLKFSFTLCNAVYKSTSYELCKKRRNSLVSCINRCVKIKKQKTFNRTTIVASLKISRDDSLMII